MKLRQFMLALYVAGGVFSYGFAYRDIKRVIIEQPAQPGSIGPQDRAAIGAGFVAPVWPLYWSIRLAEISQEKGAR